MPRHSPFQYYVYYINRSDPFRTSYSHVLTLSLSHRICNVYEEMAARASETPETTAQLVELVNYIQDCRDCAMFDLKEKSRTTAEYVIFLMNHAHLSCT